MIDLKVNINTQALKQRVQEIQGIMEEQMQGLSKEVAEAVLTDAKARCPVDTGYLRDSGYIEPYENGYRVGFSADYAIYAHEQPQSMHKNGESRFLYKALQRVAGEDNEYIKLLAAQKVKEGLNK